MEKSLHLRMYQETSDGAGCLGKKKVEKIRNDRTHHFKEYI